MPHNKIFRWIGSTIKTWSYLSCPAKERGHDFNRMSVSQRLPNFHKVSRPQHLLSFNKMPIIVIYFTKRLNAGGTNVDLNKVGACHFL